MIGWVETLSTPPFIGKGRVYIEDPVRYDCIRPELYLYLPNLQDLILYLSSKPPRFSAF
jgi:hypothetical protein